VEIHEIKLIEDDEMLGRGRRPSPLRYVVEGDGCWRVINRAYAGLPGKSYPMMSYRGKITKVSRFMWVMVVGKELSRTEKLSSTCGNTWCVNPEHHEKKEMTDVLNR